MPTFLSRVQMNSSFGPMEVCRRGRPQNSSMVLVSVFVLVVFIRGVPAIINQEGRVLLEWKSSLNTTISALGSWDARDDEPCSWTGIRCSPSGFVTEINIQNSEISGNVPSQFASLSYLRCLIISNTNLTGNIPQEIGSYGELEILDLSGNRLKGTIPAEIGMLNKLSSLILDSNQLEGTIPPELGQCTSLVNLLVFDNQLSGQIPPDLGRLSGLEVFRAGGNPNLEGALPDELSNCTNLVTLGLAETNISGFLPSWLGYLRKLQTLAIYTASLSGPIPPELGSCSELKNLYLYGNGLFGRIPPELGQLPKLERLLLWQNNLIGSIPPQLGNCSSLKVIDLSINSLSGIIPPAFGNLRNLVELQLSDNNVSGSIPSELVNCTGLTQLQFDNNQLSGQIPAELGELKNLTLMFLWQNKLEGEIPSALGGCDKLQALDLSHNLLTGTIPASIFQLKNLTKLLILSNDLTGPLPPEIGNCLALVRLRLGNNRLNDPIPTEIGRLENLVFLELGNNELSGPIPPELVDCSQLQMLDLHGNRLSGALPARLGFLTTLQVMDVSTNKLTGSIPLSFVNLSRLNKLMLNANNLSGAIPSELSQCSNLQFLDLSNNRFTGLIPPEIGKIQGLDISLNLSWNYLSGSIPEQFSGLTKLAYLDLSHNNLSGNLSCLGQLENLALLNVSFNNFSGSLPDTNFFRSLSPSAMAGNAALCTSGAACFSPELVPNTSDSHQVKLVISILFGITAILLFLGICLVIQGRRRTGLDDDSDSSWPWQMTPFQKVSFTVKDVVDALVDTNVIGKGCSGVVYKAQLGNGDVVAVKKLWTGKDSENSEKRDSFTAEVSTLSSIRHRNIVRLLGCCTNRRSKLLMYDYMPNGSLGGLMHEKRHMLDWEIRYKIILGAAEGLAYLHHDCRPPILHRDVKANNILLGTHYEPYLGDFGLAKLVDSSDFSCSATTVAGSYGYIAPEYGYRMRITEKSDVYSYGVVLLEVITGKQPIDPTIPEGVHLVDWVRQALQNNNNDPVEVVDPRLQGRPNTQIQEMLQALGVAFLCVNSNPEERPTMKDVAAMLTEIRHDSCEDCAGKVAIDLKQSSPLSTPNNNNNNNNIHRHPPGIRSSSSSSFQIYSTTPNDSRSLRSYSSPTPM